MSALSPPLSKRDFTLFMYTFERCQLQTWFSCLLSHLSRQAILFSPIPTFPLREVHHKTPGAIVFSSFYSHSYIFFTPHLCLSNVDIFKSTTLGEMFNRRGTGGTLACASRAKVITGYVSSPDVLLATIDFHLFICSFFILLLKKQQ